MKKTFLFLVISVLCTSLAYTQNANLTVQSQMGVNVDTILQRHVAGEGVVISNGKFNNQTGNVTYPQIGTFNRNGFTNFPFERGIVLTTGDVSIAAGANNSYGASQAVSNMYVETALSSYTDGHNVSSSASLEFDFVAEADTFAFNYIFGSEEYCEYVNTQFNDVFAFILTGYDATTGLPSTKNIAIIPNSITTAHPNGIPVSINTVNHGYHDQYSNGPGTQPSNSQYFIHNNYGNTGIQYDGYTTALSAQSRIIACQPYHMKLAVANVGGTPSSPDVALDSGVFIEEGSFYSPHVKVSKTWETEHGGDTLIQNCRDLDLTFTIDVPMRASNTDIIIQTSGNAVLGYDYTMTKPDGSNITIENNMFTYPRGDTVQEVHVEMVPTVHFPEGVASKTAVLYVITQGCSTFSDLVDQFHKVDTIVIYLRANDSVRLRDTAITVCNGLNEIAVKQVSGSAPTYYEWIPNTGITHPDQLATECNITQSRNYQVVASDQWGCMTDTAHVQVNIVPKPEFTITYTPDHGCMPLPVILQAQYTPNYATLHWTITNDSLYNHKDSTNNLHLELPEPGYYDISLLVESAPGCSDSISYPNAIHVSDFPHASFVFSPEEPGNGEEVFFYNYSTGENITNYAWSFGDGHSAFVEEPSHTYHLTESDYMTVHLTVTNSDGCSDDTIAVVPVEDNFAFFVPNAFTPNTDGNNEIFLPKVHDVTNYDFTIYTRTGELIFYTNNPDEGWDGTVKGAPAPQGVYVWTIHYAKIGTPDEIMVKTGSLTLIR